MYQGISGTYGIWMDGKISNQWTIGQIAALDKGKFENGYVRSMKNTMCPNFDNWNATLEFLNSKWSLFSKGRATFTGKPLFKKQCLFSISSIIDF